jgi:hypothetical protein
VEVLPPVHGSCSKTMNTRLDIFFEGNLMRGLVPLAIGDSSIHIGIELEPTSTSPTMSLASWVSSVREIS